MTAVEYGFPDRSSGFSWLSLAQGVFNTQIKRWDTSSCGGGLRWQIWPYQNGYGMKNSISNGGLFQLSARLARYTGSSIYLEWANKIWDWSVSSPLLSNTTWNVADSTNVDNDCATQGNDQWTYNYGTYLMGAAYMYNYVSSRVPVSIMSRGLRLKSITNIMLLADEWNHSIPMADRCRRSFKCNTQKFLYHRGNHRRLLLRTGGKLQ